VTTDKSPQPGDSLGDRIKRYEAASRPFLTPNTPVLIRVDGKAFHTWTKGFDRPFDMPLIQAMVQATRQTARQMQGFKLAYTQSDEATFLITDTDRLESQPWYGYSANKLVSITASMFTAYFNKAIGNLGNLALSPAFFDARAFNVPFEDAANVFIWRQRDWARNSVMMCAQWHFSHGKLQGKKSNEAQEMMFRDYGFNWADLDPPLKNGTFITRADETISEKLSYTDIDAMINYVPPEPE
jgi:tRNA(His) 5'-end guanylyltransferase